MSRWSKQLKASKMAKIKQFEAFTKIFVAYKKNGCNQIYNTQSRHSRVVLLYIYAADTPTKRSWVVYLQHTPRSKVELFMLWLYILRGYNCKLHNRRCVTYLMRQVTTVATVKTVWSKNPSADATAVTRHNIFKAHTCNKKEVLPTPEFPIRRILNIQSKFISLYSAQGGEATFPSLESVLTGWITLASSAVILSL